MTTNPFIFSIRCRHGQARVGKLVTPHGVIDTPAFVPVGTQATVKSLTPDELDKIGVQLFFVNTYHMYLRPGISVIKKFGSLRQFMNWKGPLMTDSGGFQIFSLGVKRLARVTTGDNSSAGKSLVKIDEDGVVFTSHWDGSEHFFTPEKSIETQQYLGADIILAFDECLSYPTTKENAKKAMERTHRWAKRSYIAHRKFQAANTGQGRPYQAFYGVIQGSVFEDLRQESAGVISSMDIDGIAIGGVSVGESKKEMVDVLNWTTPFFPEEKPRHLLGVGEIDDVFALVEHGIDTFDCVQPTRLARMGHLMAAGKFTFDITKRIYAQDMDTIDQNCDCYTCENFSRAYLHHLFRVRELLAYRLATIHNLAVMNRLMAEIRQGISDKKLKEVKQKWLGKES